jgi:hypothetical protein
MLSNLKEFPNNFGNRALTELMEMLWRLLRVPSPQCDGVARFQRHIVTAQQIR